MSQGSPSPTQGCLSPTGAAVPRRDPGDALVARCAALLTPSLQPLRSICLALACLVAVAGPLTHGAAAHAPHDVIKTIALSPDFANDQTIFAFVQYTERTLFARSVDGGLSWREFGNPMSFHLVESFSFSPDFANDDTAFAATFSGGVYKTTDGGDTWTATNTGLTSLTVFDIQTSPGFASNQLVVAATEQGSFRSTDGGATWNAANTGLVETALTQVTFSGDGTALYTGSDVMHRSTDGGLTWEARSPLPAPMTSLMTSPLDPTGQTVVTAFGRQGGGVFLSTDGGLLFNASLTGLTDLRVNDAYIAVDGRAFASTSEDGCFVATDVTGPWSASLVGLEVLSPLTGNHYFQAVTTADFATDDTVYLASYEGLYISDDAGASWRQQETYTQDINRLLTVSPDFANDGTVFVGNYGGGVFSGRPPGLLGANTAPHPGTSTVATSAENTAGAGVTALGSVNPGSGVSPVPAPGANDADIVWREHGTGITLFSSLITLSPDYASDGTLFYGYTGLYRSTDRGLSWETLTKPGTIDVVRALGLSPDFASDGTVFLGSFGEGTYKSLDGADNWIQLTGGLPADVRSTFMLCSPDFSADQTVFMSTREDGMWRSTDGGTNWTLVGLESQDVRALVLSPAFASDDTAFAGTVGSGLFRTTDGGDTWLSVNTGIAPPGEAIVVEGVAPSPDFASDGIVFVSTLSHGVFKSTDSGSTWTPSGNGLPVEASRMIAVSPEFPNDQTLFHTTHDWIWRSRDGGGSWHKLPGTLRVDDRHQSVQYSGDWGFLGFDDGGGVDSTCVCPPVPNVGRRRELVVDAEDPGSLGAGIASHTAAALLNAGSTGGTSVERTRRSAGSGSLRAAGFGAQDLDPVTPAYTYEPEDGGIAPLVILELNYGPGIHRSDSAGDVMEFRFFGDSISWIAVRDAESGRAAIEIDDVPVATVDLFSPATRYQERVFTQQFESAGWHTIRITNTGSAHPLAGDIKLFSDGFRFTF